MTIRSSLFTVLAALLSCCALAQPKPGDVTSAPPLNACMVPHTGAVLAGDYPDPSIIRVNGDYWAASTTSAWLPAFSLMHSTDLANWTVVGSVFKTSPAWASQDFWAPELSHMGSTFFVYYAARNKTTNLMCVGVGTSDTPGGPYQDHGPIQCGPIGDIDPAPVVDDDGHKYLVWKEDGNSVNKPTRILLQRLTDDGLQLQGQPREIVHNDSPWEGAVTEAPFIMKHGGQWYLIYSGNACCGSQCNYAVGAARTDSLENGTWVKDPANPILKGNEAWHCPGHGSIVQDPDGHDVFMYHAYNATDSIYVGRQAMADVVDWGADGWPTINSGKGPSSHADGLLGHVLLNKEHVFSDDFALGLKPGWQFPHEIKPTYTASGGLTLQANSTDPLSSVIARETTTSNYAVTTVIDMGAMRPTATATLSAYGDSAHAIGATVGNGQVRLWTKAGKKQSLLGYRPLTSAGAGPLLYIRMTASSGDHFIFDVSRDGKTWATMAPAADMKGFVPWDLGVRLALSAGGSQGDYAVFRSFAVEPTASQK